MEMKNSSRILALALLFFLCTGCAVPKSYGPQEHSAAMKLVDQGILMIRQGQIDRAQASFQTAYEMVPTPAAVDGLGCVAFIKGDFKRAELLFWEAYDMDNRYTTSLGNLALLYESQGYLVKAAEMYQLVLDAEPENFRARNNFAGFLNDYKNGRTSGETLRQLLQAQSVMDNPTVRKNVMKFDEDK